ncbi:MAG: protein kinase, partial [archaeon]|nr:protein kinase [archaeon]
MTEKEEISEENNNNIKTISPKKLSDTNHKKHRTISQFMLGEKLGEGTFGVVRLATHVITGEKVAVKILDKQKILEEADKVRIEREIKILKNLRHNNIIHLYSVIQTTS